MVDNHCEISKVQIATEVCIIYQYHNHFAVEVELVHSKKAMINGDE